MMKCTQMTDRACRNSAEVLYRIAEPQAGYFTSAQGMAAGSPRQAWSHNPCQTRDLSSCPVPNWLQRKPFRRLAGSGVAGRHLTRQRAGTLWSSKCITRRDSHHHSAHRIAPTSEAQVAHGSSDSGGGHAASGLTCDDHLTNPGRRCDGRAGRRIGCSGDRASHPEGHDLIRGVGTSEHPLLQTGRKPLPGCISTLRWGSSDLQLR
jgi:hypothetical protein